MADAKENGGPAIAGTAIFENLLDQRELSAVKLSRKIRSHFHTSFGLGDLRLQPLFHGRLLR